MDKEELKPVIFSITDETDLKKLYVFRTNTIELAERSIPMFREHYLCMK